MRPILSGSLIHEGSSSVSKSMPSIATAGTGGGQVFADLGYYKAVIVALKHIKKDHLQLTRDVLLEFNDVCTCFLHIARYENKA